MQGNYQRQAGLTRTSRAHVSDGNSIGDGANLNPLLSGSRWAAIVVAGFLIVAAAFVAFSGTVVLSVPGATFTAGLGLISTGLTAFFWYVDRKDRIQIDAQRTLARLADTRPYLEFQQEVLDGGEGHLRREVWLLNHGPGSANSLVITLDGLEAKALGSVAQSKAAWTLPAIEAQAAHRGPFRRAGLAPGASNRVLIYRDADVQSTGGTQLPLGPNDIAQFCIVRLNVNCRDADGRVIEPCTGYLERTGGYYTPRFNSMVWINGWGLSA